MGVVLTDKRFFCRQIEKKFGKISKKLEVKPCKTEAELLQNVSEAEAIMTTSAQFSGKVINALKNCKIIVRCGIGVDNIDIAIATKRLIYVANTPGFYVDEVSNHVMALLLALSRKIHLINRLVRVGRYDFGSIQPIYSLNGKTLGLLGFGRIGKAIFEKTRSFNLKCLVYDPYVSGKSIKNLGVEMVDLESLLSNSDFVSVNCPLTQETRGLLGKSQFKMMKKTALIINTARGGIIDEAELANALRNGLIAGAALDVLIDEPPKKNNPLLKFDNVLVTPHIGWYSEEAIAKMGAEAAEEVCRVFNGKLPKNLVNIELKNP